MNKLFNILLTALVLVSGSAFAGCGSCKKSTAKTTQRKHGRRLSARVAVRAAALHRSRFAKKAKPVSKKNRKHTASRPMRRAGCRSCKRNAGTVATPTVITLPVSAATTTVASIAPKQTTKGEKGCKDGSCPKRAAKSTEGETVSAAK